MNSPLIHIFDNSACLTKRQLKDYVAGSMTNEESHAVQVHLNSCPFCNTAVEGLFAQKENDLLAVDAIGELNSNFLKDHFSLTNPQIHLNSLAPATQQVHTIGRERKKKRKAQPLWRITSIAAALLLVFGLLWLLDYGNNKITQKQLAQTATIVTEPAMEKNETPYTAAPATEETTIADNVTDNSNSEVTVTNEPQPAPPTREMPGNNQSQRPQALLLTGNDDNEVKKTENTEADKTATKYKKEADLASNESATAAPKPEAENKTPAQAASFASADVKAVRLEATNAKKERRNRDADASLSADEDMLENGHELYAQKKYSKALTSFRKEMNSTNNRRRQEATIMAARCYINIGERGKAENLLNNIIEEGGPQKKAAKKLLRNLYDE